jgi:hypothetical protein
MQFRRNSPCWHGVFSFIGSLNHARIIWQQ